MSVPSSYSSQSIYDHIELIKNRYSLKTLYKSFVEEFGTDLKMVDKNHLRHKSKGQVSITETKK